MTLATAAPTTNAAETPAKQTMKLTPSHAPVETKHIFTTETPKHAMSRRVRFYFIGKKHFNCPRPLVFYASAKL